MSIKYRIRTVQGLVAKAYPDADSANEVARQWRLQGMIDVSVVEVIETEMPEIHCFEVEDFYRGLIFRNAAADKSFIVWRDKQLAMSGYWGCLELTSEGASETINSYAALNESEVWQGLIFVDTADRYLVAAKDKAPAVAEWLENWLEGRAK